MALFAAFLIIVANIVNQQHKFNFYYLLNLIILIFIINFNYANQFFDKSIPDSETILTQADFHRFHQRQKREEQKNEFNNINKNNNNNIIIDDSSMYNKERFEGDILTAVNPAISSPLSSIKNSINEEINLKPQNNVQRNAVRQSFLKWPHARIPYTVSTQYTSYGRERIAEAIDEYNKKTCIEWTPKTSTDIDYVHILPDDGCYSLVGKVGGKQPVSLGEGCMTIGIVIHELMHSVGFFHEQSRTDRDSFVNILWENIDPTLRDQFDKYSQNMIDYLGAKYDYFSVMHYGPLAFTKNGKATIEPKEKGVVIGQRLGFSPTDLYKVNKLYNCPNLGQQQPSQQQLSPVPISIISSTGNIGTTNNNKCLDLRSDCSFIANRETCNSLFSSSFMNTNCPKSCGNCPSNNNNNNNSPIVLPTDCNDNRDWCSRWANSGMCDLYIFQKYMHSVCQLSCGIC